MNTKTVLLFPGQGSQESGMGRDIAESSKEAMSLWKQAETISGLPLRSVYWDSNDTELMANTQYLQPALTVVNITLYQSLHKYLTNSFCVAGHSLGEFSALVAAKIITPKLAIELTSLRGKLMAEINPNENGGMAAILRLKQKDVEDIVANITKESGETLVIANYNTPTQLVVSGSHKALELLLPLVKQHKGKAVPLPVNGAFHSPLMTQAAQHFSKALTQISLTQACCPIYLNSTGCSSTETQYIYKCINQQMTSSVFWSTIITTQWYDGYTQWIELGPKGVLSRMIAPNLESIQILQGFSSTSISSLETLKEHTEALHA